MRILICHGYLLKGTGSNEYVQALARALCRDGHHIIVMCQEEDPDLDFVSSFIRESHEKTPQLAWEKQTDYPGSCLVYKPYIAGLLPVYVLDDYPGFEVKPFTELDDGELEQYMELNKRSLRRLIEQFVPEAIQVNHAVMLPAIVRGVAEDAAVPYFVTIHGSAIEFAVKKDVRYLHHGATGLQGSSGIIVPSEHSGEQVVEVFDGLVEGIKEKIRFVPPGVDTDMFRPAETSLPESVEALISAVEPRVQGITIGDFMGEFPGGSTGPTDDDYVEHEIARINAMHPDWLPEPDLPEKLRAVARGDRSILMFIGKMLETKGIQCVLPALPLVLEHHPAACLVVVGFGELWGMLEMMLEAIDTADVRALKVLCDYGNRHYSGLTASPFTPVLEFLETLAGEGMMDEYLRLCMEVDVAGSVVFTGYLKPEEHRHILPYARALLVPSLAPEAFGLVATEAMAAGVPPIACTHSGLATALVPFEKAWGEQAELLELGTREKMVFRIAAASRVVLDMPLYTLREQGARMRELVGETFSWDAVAHDTVALFKEAAGMDRTGSDP